MRAGGHGRDGFASTRVQTQGDGAILEQHFAHERPETLVGCDVSAMVSTRQANGRAHTPQRIQAVVNPLTKAAILTPVNTRSKNEPVPSAWSLIPHETRLPGLSSAAQLRPSQVSDPAAASDTAMFYGQGLQNGRKKQALCRYGAPSGYGVVTRAMVAAADPSHAWRSGHDSHGAGRGIDPAPYRLFPIGSGHHGLMSQAGQSQARMYRPAPETGRVDRGSGQGPKLLQGCNHGLRCVMRGYRYGYQ